MVSRKPIGFVLISVLWLIALLTTIALSMSSTMRNETKIVNGLSARTQATLAAEAGVQLAVARIWEGDAKSWTGDGSMHEFQIANARVRVAVFDESGKIDLNVASQTVLEALLVVVDVDSDASSRIVDAILDWRDRDGIRRLHGAEDADYLAAGRDYGAADDRFQEIEELLMVLGVTDEVFKKIRDSVTVYARQVAINPLVAPRNVLLAVSGLGAVSVDEFVEQRAETGLQALRNLNLDRNLVSIQQSRYVTVVANARCRGASARVTATVALDKSKPRSPYEVLRWSPTGIDLFEGGDVEASAHAL